MSLEELAHLQKLPTSQLSNELKKMSQTNESCYRIVPKWSGNVLRIKIVDSFDGLEGDEVKDEAIPDDDHNVCCKYSIHNVRNYNEDT